MEIIAKVPIHLDHLCAIFFCNYFHVGFISLQMQLNLLAIFVEFDGKGVVPEVAEFANSIVSGKPDSRQSPEEAQSSR
jgi:hypothetical protein